MLPPATILLIIQGLQAALTAAPQVVALVEHAYGVIAELFKAGLIDQATQNTLRSHVDSVMEELLAGRVPPEFRVDPDPAGA